MSRKPVFGSLLFVLVLISCIATPSGGTQYVSAQTYKLHIYLGPSQVLADNITNNIFVQIQDASGTPIRASSNLTVSLSSSLTNVGTIDSSAVIQTGSIGAWAKFTSTYSPGSTTITATAPGYSADQAVITTVGAQPSTIAVYALPPSLPADGNSYSAIVVQLQDSNGFPAKAPFGNVQVTLLSSNTTVGSVDPTVVIAAGTTFATANFHTFTNVIGSATITAIASGYSSGQATLTMQKPTANPFRLQVYTGPTKVLADGGTNQIVAIQIVDPGGTISQTPSNLTALLTSSATDVATIGSTITISTNQTYSIASITSTLKSGTTSITAAATNFVSGQAYLTTTGSVPSKLAVFGIPSSLPANHLSYGAVVVQLQDNLGNPAKQPSGQTVINLLSSNPSVGNVSSPVTIPSGQTQVVGTILTTLVAGSFAVTAQAIGYAQGQTDVTTYPIDSYPLSLSATANPATVTVGKSLNITAYVSLPDSTPVLGATVQFASSNGTFLVPIDEGNGSYLSTFTPPIVAKTTSFSVVVNASKTGYTSANFTLQVTVTVLPLSLSATANPATVTVGKSLDITAYVTLPDSTPVLGATVQFTSDSNGTFLVPIDEGNGSYLSTFTPPIVTKTTNFIVTVNASKTGYTSASSILQLTVTVVGVVVTATPNPISEDQTSNITAHLTYADQTPVLGAIVNFTSSRGGIFSAVIDEGNGYYQSVFTPPTIPSYSTVNFTITSSANVAGEQENASVLLTVRSSTYEFQAGKVQFHVQDKNGNPIDQASIISTQAVNMVTLVENTNQTGDVTFSNVSSGSYIFQVTKSGYDTQTVNITLATNETATRTVTLASQTQLFSNTTIGILIAVIVIATVATAIIVAFRKRNKKMKTTHAK